jgi:hypothetical protein
MPTGDKLVGAIGIVRASPAGAAGRLYSRRLQLYRRLVRIYQPTGGAARLSMVIDRLVPSERADDA